MISVPRDFPSLNARRIALAASGGKPDLVPVLVAPDSTFYQEYAGLSAGDYFADPELMLQAQLKARERFYGLPSLSPSFYPAVEASALGCEVWWPKDQVGAPLVKPLVQSLGDLRRLKVPDPAKDGLMPRVLAYMDHFRERLSGGEGLAPTPYDGVGPFDLACLLRGTEGAFLDVHEDPGLLHRLLEVATETCIRWLEAVESRYGPVETVSASADYGAYLGPADFEEFVVPYTRRVFAAFPGRRRLFHSDGDFSARTLSQLVKLGIDHFYLFSSKLDIAQVREALGPRVCLTGNVDPLKLIQGTPEEVKREARACLERAGAQGAFILSSGGFMGAGTRPENVDALIQASLEG